MIDCPRWRVLQLSCGNKREGLLPDCRVGVKESESEDCSSWMPARMATYISELCMSLSIAWQGRLRVSQTAGCMQASGTCLAWPLVHSMDSLASSWLTVKLSPCPCSRSSPAGWIAACLCGHSKCNLLLAHDQARPRMIQHLTSYITDTSKILMVL